MLSKISFSNAAVRSVRHIGQRAFASKAAESDSNRYPSFARGLFAGKLETSHVHPYPEVLSSEQRDTLSMLVDPVTKFFDETNDAARNDEEAAVPEEITEALKEMGAFGLQVPEELNGIGLSNTGYARLVEVVGGADLGVGIYLGAHQSIGFKGILLAGNEEQKAKYLPKLATGETIAAFALTEPTSGSDANSIRTRAELSEDGKHYILNGGKIWISNGGIAEIFTVFAQTPVKDEKTGEIKNKVTAFIVERGFGGVTSGPPEKKMGIKCSNTAEVHFDNVKIPVENVLGKVGGGFKVAMEILNNGRFGMGAALTGTMKKCIAGVAEHANNRVQFGRKLKDFQLIQGKFASMATRCYAAESLAYAVAGNMDRGATDYQLEAACSKIFASEAAWYVADEAIQVMGGLGYMKEYPYERILRDLRIFRIFEGTNDILRLFIALTGMQSLGKDLQPVAEAMKAPWSNLTVILPEAIQMARDKVGMRENPSVSWAPKALTPAATHLSECTGLFGSASKQLLVKRGKKIIEHQLELERVADCVIDLYAMGATTARATRAIERNSASHEHETMLANAFAEEAALRIKQNVALIKGKGAKLNQLRGKVAKHVFEQGGYAAEHPIGF